MVGNRSERVDWPGDSASARAPFFLSGIPKIRLSFTMLGTFWGYNIPGSGSICEQGHMPSLTVLENGETLFSACSVRCGGNDVDPAAVAVEFDVTIYEGEDRVIPAKADIATREKFCSSLTDEDVARYDGLTAKFFHAQPFALTVASVFDTALTFFMSHKIEWVKIRP